MVLAFCRRGSVIPICLYLLVGRYMKVRSSFQMSFFTMLNEMSVTSVT